MSSLVSPTHASDLLGMGNILSTAPDMDLHTDTSVSAASGAKRRAASPTMGNEVEETPRKRTKLEHDNLCEPTDIMQTQAVVDGQRLAADLAQELECGCCSAVVHRPVTVVPCQHFFCGSCCALWIKNGGTHCPSCRGTSNMVVPSRTLEKMVEILVRADPSYARSAREKEQADEVYSGGLLRIPYPRDSSPPPNIPMVNSNLARPCPHCIPDNPFGWYCPEPIRDPESDPDNAWNLDDGAPPGHVFCGHCEDIMALEAPHTNKCDMCRTLFCGLAVPSRCIATALLAQHPFGFAEVSDLLQSPELYDAFHSNEYEVELLLAYLTREDIIPRDIYRDTVSSIINSSKGFAPLFEDGLFGEPGDIDVNAPRNKICRSCAADVLIWGIRAWWVRERRGALSADLLARPDCPDGRRCNRQEDLAHAKEFNHIVEVPEAVERPTTPMPVIVDSIEMPNTVASGPILAGETVTLPFPPTGAPGHADLNDHAALT